MIVRHLVASVTAVCAIAGLAAPTPTPAAAQERSGVRRISWEDTAPVRARVVARGMTADSFPSFVERTRQANARRVREGDLDHLVFYLLQSTRFTSLPPIEPAISAKTVVEGLDGGKRQSFLGGGGLDLSVVPAAVTARASALLRAIDSPGGDARLKYFGGLVESAFPDRRTREPALLAEYLRAMRFVYQKEFVAQRADRVSDAVAELYRTRGLSTDTAVEAGFLVHYGLGIARSLDERLRVRRVLIIGPGIDLAPRTALLELSAPESYQPWAVIDAVLAHGLATPDELEVVGADINPRVVEHLGKVRRDPPLLTLASEIRESGSVKLSAEFRDYFERLGQHLGKPGKTPAKIDTGRLAKTVHVAPHAARSLHSVHLDIVTERLDGPQFDLVVATNILPYFDDDQLTLALANIAAMLASGGVLLHNEPRPAIGDITEDLGLSFLQSRHVVIAAVSGAGAPLFDSVFLHRKR